MVYKFADFNIEIHNKKNKFSLLCDGYEAPNAISEISFEVTPEEIEIESQKSNITVYKGTLEYLAIYRKIAEWLPTQNAFLLHSAVFDIDGIGIAFSAQSGTGKTTHMMLWQHLLGEKLKVVNGDKPIIRFFDNQPETPYAYGTPWNGKEHFGSNMRTIVKHICFIERASENSCEPINSEDAVSLLLKQVYIPKDQIALSNTISLINRLISSCKLWKIKCNTDIAAAKTSYNTIFNLKE